MRLYDLPKCVIAGFQLYTEDKAKACLRAVRDHVKASPREVATMFELNWSPPNKKTGVRRPFAQILPIYLGDSEKEGMEMLKDVMTAVPDPFVKNVGKLPYSTLQSMLVQHIPPSFRTETAVFVPDMPEELIDILIEQFNKSPLPGTFLACFAFGGAIGDKEPGDTAFPWRLKNGHWITCLASAQNIEDHKKMEGVLLVRTGTVWGTANPSRVSFGEYHSLKFFPGWVAETGSKIIKFATGSFVNRIGNASTSDSSYERSVDYFGQNAKRLLELKKRYDPKNAFRNSDSGALLAGEVMAEEKASL